MKRKLLVILIVLCAGGAFAASMSVQVRNGKVRSKPSLLGRVVATLPYGEVVEVGEPKRKWYPVNLADSKKGWLHESALSRKSIKVAVGTLDVQTDASNDEVSLAAKGFDETVEAKLKEERGLDYTWVDRMAEFQVSSDQITAFLTEGQLTGGDL